MRQFEYKTTYGDLFHSNYDHQEDIHTETPPDNPVPPEGTGWELVGFTASTKKLYWCWRRPAPVKSRGAK